jgi:hypothetical protein
VTNLHGGVIPPPTFENTWRESYYGVFADKATAS